MYKFLIFVVSYGEIFYEILNLFDNYNFDYFF